MGDSTYLEHILAAVDTYPSEPAVVDAISCLTYAELAQNVAILVSYLDTLQLRQGRFIGVCLPRDSSLVVALLAVQFAGCAYVPIDPKFPAERNAYILEDAEIDLVLTSKKMDDVIFPDTVKTINVDQLPAGYNQAHDANHSSLRNTLQKLRGYSLNSSQTAYMIYTSGSTGNPKGVPVSLSNLTNFLESMRVTPGLVAQERVLALTTISFDIAQLELFLPLTAGASTYIARTEDTSDGFTLSTLVEGHQISLMQATPSTWRLLKAAEWEGSDRLKALSGGEPLNVELAGWLSGRVASLWNMYGPTETTVWSSCTRITESDLHSGQLSIGHPIANTTFYICKCSDDGRSLELCQSGEQGELLIGGAGVSTGYYRREKLTSERFIANPFNKPHDPSINTEIIDPVLYRTGDLVSVQSDGRYLCHGRMDDQIKIRGYRIEPGEIESVIEQVAGVEAAAVSMQLSNDVQMLSAYIEFKKNHDDNLQNTVLHVQEKLSESLPKYMIPQLLFSVSAMPKTPNGKLDRKSLVLAGYPGITPVPWVSDTLVESQSQYAIPQSFNSVESDVAEMWRELLGQPVTDGQLTFFDAGGNSLLAMSFIKKAFDKYDLRIPFRSLVTDSLAQVSTRLSKSLSDTTVNSSDTVSIERSIKRTSGFLPSGRRRIFYQIHKPFDTSPQGVVLIVPPLQHEYMRSYREMYLLADMLASAGNCVFRFDFSGTGQSALTSDEVMLEDWLKDINDIARYACEEAGQKTLDVVSARGGSLLALSVNFYLESQLTLNRHVMWYPIFSGAELTSELRSMSEELLSDLDRFRWRVGARHDNELMGHKYHQELIRQLSKIHLDPRELTDCSSVHIVAGNNILESDVLPQVKLRTGTNLQIQTDTLPQIHIIDESIDWDDASAAESMLVFPQALDKITRLLQ